MSHLAHLFACFLHVKPLSIVGVVLRNVRFILVSYVGIYTGHLCCIVKLPDEVCVSQTKRVGENKSFYNRALNNWALNNKLARNLQ